jgi:hypothetical protein
MAQPVWVLSVDLQTKTATFQSGMSEAARSARESFTEIKSGAGEMGRATSGSMMEARHGVMLLGEEFGVHLPRALTTFIASIGPIGAAMEAAFPFLAIVVGATLLLQHLSKLKEEGQALTTSQLNFGTTVANVLNGLNDKLLQAGIRADELRGDHLAALNKELQRIDHQSMEDLAQAFNSVSKAADVTFADLKTHWYQFGAGASGAKNALDTFKAQYESLLAQGKNKEATDLLAGTRQSAERVLQLQNQIRENQTKTGSGGTHQGDYLKFEQASIELKRMGIGYTDKEVQAQETLVEALRAQVTAQETINSTKKLDQNNVRQTEQNRGDVDSDKVARAQAESQRQAADEAEKLWEENYRRAVDALQENERMKIEATDKGSAARLAAINAAIKEEESKGLQENGFYRDLLTSRVKLISQMNDEQREVNAEAGKENANQTATMARLQLAADEETEKHKLAIHRATSEQLAAADVKAVQDSVRIEVAGYNLEIQALDKHAADYSVKLQALEDKKLQIEKQGQNKIQEIQDQSNQKQLAALQKFAAQEENAFATGFSKVLTGKQSFAHMMQNLDGQMASEAIRFSLMALMAQLTADGRSQMSSAKKAASKAWASAPNPIIGAVEAAATFVSVMALEQGGIVPGVTRGDSVPALLTPGEAVLPKPLTEGLQNAARSGNFGKSGGDLHVHNHFSPQIHAMDGDSVDRVLTEHKDTFAKHFDDHVRKQNG